MGLPGILSRPRKRTSTSQGVTLGQVIAFANQKGGVAKTTTTLNLAVAFRELGYRVLAVDLDPQGNLTMSQGMNPDEIEVSMFDVLVRQVPIQDAIRRVEVDHEHAEALLLEGDGEVQRRRRLRDAALLVREDDHPLQRRLLGGVMCPGVRAR